MATDHLALRLAAPLVDAAFALGDRSDRCRPAPSDPIVLRYGPAPEQTLGYWPGEASQGPPIVFLHGGGWCAGHWRKATGRAKIAHWRQRGFATLDYRLAPAVAVEDQLADCAAALTMLASATTAPFRCVLMGHSAGAHLALLLAADRRWSASPHVAGVIAIDGVAYDVASEIDESPRLLRPFFRAVFGPDRRRWQDLSPTAHAHRSTPPCLVLHTARRDGTRQAHLLTQSWRDAGADCTMAALPGRGLSAHIASNRRLGDPAYPATPIIDRWLEQRPG